MPRWGPDLTAAFLKRTGWELRVREVLGHRYPPSCCPVWCVLLCLFCHQSDSLWLCCLRFEMDYPFTPASRGPAFNSVRLSWSKASHEPSQIVAEMAWPIGWRIQYTDFHREVIWCHLCYLPACNMRSHEYLRGKARLGEQVLSNMRPVQDKRGFSTHHLGLVYTLFSASNYCGTAGNKAMENTSYHAADTGDSAGSCADSGIYTWLQMPSWFECISGISQPASDKQDGLSSRAIDQNSHAQSSISSIVFPFSKVMGSRWQILVTAGRRVFAGASLQFCQWRRDSTCCTFRGVHPMRC